MALPDLIRVHFLGLSINEILWYVLFNVTVAIIVVIINIIIILHGGRRKVSFCTVRVHSFSSPLSIVNLFKFGHSNCCVEAILCGFNLMNFPND